MGNMLNNKSKSSTTWKQNERLNDDYQDHVKYSIYTFYLKITMMDKKPK